MCMNQHWSRCGGYFADDDGDDLSADRLPKPLPADQPISREFVIASAPHHAWLTRLS